MTLFFLQSLPKGSPGPIPNPWRLRFRFICVLSEVSLVEVNYQHGIAAPTDQFCVLQLGLLDLLEEEVMHMKCLVSSPGILYIKYGWESSWRNICRGCGK
ncbi:hypothetical protein PIB30_090697 [Stylosanthes scabra]|uniref:Uncharacterized protein n=1 Tax=Stylosanthes scabra TaxID=79078 RepID=A0ABU6VUP1_9FABA|nr:hypothetical protein [Stylosanthes scabra]